MSNNNQQVFSTLSAIGDTAFLPRNGRSDETLRMIVAVQSSRKGQVLTVLDRQPDGWTVALASITRDVPRSHDGPLKVTHDTMGRQAKPPYDWIAFAGIRSIGDTATLSRAGRSAKSMARLQAGMAHRLGCELTVLREDADTVTLKAMTLPAAPIQSHPLPAYVWDPIREPGGYIDLLTCRKDVPSARMRLMRQARKLRLTVRIKLLDNPLRFRVSL